METSANKHRTGVIKWLEKTNVEQSDWNALINDFLRQENFQPYKAMDKYEFISRRFPKFTRFIMENTEEVK